MRYLFLQEYVRVQHTTQHKNGDVTIDFMSSEAGRELKKRVRSVGIDVKDIDYKYVYPQVPDAKTLNKQGTPISYADPKQKDVKPYYPELNDFIIENKPEVVIPNGKLGCKHLLGSVSITKLRGIPEQVTLENDKDSHTFWVLPIFSMEYVMASPSVDNYVTTDFELLSQYNEKGSEVFEPSEVSYEFVDNIERVREIFNYLYNEKPLTAWDLETNTLKPETKGAKALVISLSWQENQGVTIPLEHKEFTWQDSELNEIYSFIERFVGDKEQYKVGHNLKFDVRFLMTTKGYTEFENMLDTLIAYYLVVNQETNAPKTLSSISYELTDMGGYDKPLDDFKDNYIKDYKKNNSNKKPVNDIDGSNFNYEWIPLEILHPYASGDVDAVLRIHHVLYNRMKDNDKMVKLYTQFYPRMTRTIARIEVNGLPVDNEYRLELYGAYGDEYINLTEQIRELDSVKELEDRHRTYYEAGLEEMAKPKAERDGDVAKLRDKYKKKLEFNPNSSVDKGEVLYDILAIKLPIDKTYIKESAMNKRPQTHDDLNWEDYKTDKHTLQYLIDRPDEFENGGESKKLAELLLRISKVSTLQGYAKSYIPDDNGKLHGKLNIIGTASTRMSSSEPNLQNISSSTTNVETFDYKYPLKRMFVSEYRDEDGVIMEADYSGLEMRILGLVAKDPNMTQAFLEGKDFHKNTASIINDISEDEVTKGQRQASKAIAFGKHKYCRLVS